MREMIESRRNSEKKEERYDLLSSLLDANDDSADGLTDQEVLGTCSFELSSISLFSPLSRKHLHIPRCWYVPHQCLWMSLLIGYTRPRNNCTFFVLCFGPARVVSRRTGTCVRGDQEGYSRQQRPRTPYRHFLPLRLLTLCIRYHRHSTICRGSVTLKRMFCRAFASISIGFNHTIHNRIMNETLRMHPPVRRLLYHPSRSC